MLYSTRSGPESWDAVPLRLRSWSFPWLHSRSDHTRISLWPNEDDRPIRLFNHPAAVRKRADFRRRARVPRLPAILRSERIEVSLPRKLGVRIMRAVWISIRVVTGISGSRRRRIDRCGILAALRLLRRHPLRRSLGFRLLSLYFTHLRRVGRTRSCRRVVR